MIQQNGDTSAAGTCAYCGRPIDVVRYKLRPGAQAHGDPSDLEPVPFCSDDWSYFSQGQLPPRRRANGRTSSESRSGLTQAGCLLSALLSAALVVLTGWFLITRVLS